MLMEHLIIQLFIKNLRYVIPNVFKLWAHFHWVNQVLGRHTCFKRIKRLTVWKRDNLETQMFQREVLRTTMAAWKEEPDQH